MSFSEEPLLLLVACRDGKVYVHKMDSMEQVNVFHLYNTMLNLLAVCDTKRLFATTPADQTDLNVWNLDSGEAVFEVNGHLTIVNSIAFSDSGEWLASSSHDTVFVTDIRTKQLKYRLDVPGIFGASSLCFSENGRFLATASNGDAYLIFDIGEGTLLHEIGQYNGSPHTENFAPVRDDDVKLVRFARGGTTLSTVDSNTNDGAHVRLSEWDITTGAAMNQKFVSREDVDEVTAISPDGCMFAWSAPGLYDFGVGGSRSFFNNGVYTCAKCSPLQCCCEDVSEVLTSSFTPNSEVLVVGDTSAVVSFWVFDNITRHTSALLGRIQLLSNAHSFAFATDVVACEEIAMLKLAMTKRETLAMGLHKRLGEVSIISSLHLELVAMIGKMI